MSSIREQLIAFDTNVFIGAIREEGAVPACAELVPGYLGILSVVVPLEVVIELQRNLTVTEASTLFGVFAISPGVRVEYLPADSANVAKWIARGAKKGDAAIVAQLEQLGVSVFVTENRHFLREILELPFEVISAAEAVSRLAQG